MTVARLDDSDVEVLPGSEVGVDVLAVGRGAPRRTGDLLRGRDPQGLNPLWRRIRPLCLVRLRSGRCRVGRLVGRFLGRGRRRAGLAGLSVSVGSVGFELGVFSAEGVEVASVPEGGSGSSGAYPLTAGVDSIAAATTSAARRRQRCVLRGARCHPVRPHDSDTGSPMFAPGSE